MVPLSLDTQLGLLVPPSRENILSKTGRGVAHMSKYDSVQRVCENPWTEQLSSINILPEGNKSPLSNNALLLASDPSLFRRFRLSFTTLTLDLLRLAYSYERLCWILWITPAAGYQVPK
jgi:hypothetical protein